MARKPYLTSAQRRAKWARAQTRPGMLFTGAVSALSSLALATFAAACIAEPGPAATSQPEAFAWAVAMVCVMAIVGAGLAVVALWEARP